MAVQKARLVAGERLDRRTFHERYLDTPEDFRAELIGGTVYLPGRTTWSHGRMTARLLWWIGSYQDLTPGVEAHARTTILLGTDSEPEPDATVRLAPSHGGKTGDADDLIYGPPELVIEVADSTEELDLGPKKQDYEAAGVQEYLAVALRRNRVYWFTRGDGQFVEMSADPRGVLKSRCFPGLWLDPVAALSGDAERFRAQTAAGLASPEHAAFVARLAAHRSETAP